MPDLAVTAIQALPLPLWMAAALLILLLVIFFLAVRRSGSFASVGALFGVAALVVIAFSAWKVADHSILRQRAAEREALNARALQLTAAVLVPGSPLACLDASAGEVLEASCEAAVFLRAENVAAATAYVEAKLSLLADSLDYSLRFDAADSGTLVGLRKSLEADAYGFVAYVLAVRDGCTADACDAFGLLSETKAVKANMNARMLENKIARYSANWPAHRSAPAAAASPSELPPAVAAIMSTPTKPIDFPTAASIPPVSIMTEPPAAPASAPTEAAPARRQPAPASAASRPQ